MILVGDRCQETSLLKDGAPGAQRIVQFQGFKCLYQ
jgi:hypothetical protein